ncbi:MAG: hypothetical protein AB8I80_08545, partial [Anaerolineae bacterium]
MTVIRIAVPAILSGITHSPHTVRHAGTQTDRVQRPRARWTALYVTMTTPAATSPTIRQRLAVIQDHPRLRHAPLQHPHR